MSSPWIDRDSGPVSTPRKFESLARSDSEIKARTVLSDVDPWTAWFYKPHTLIFSFIGAALLVYASINPVDAFDQIVLNFVILNP